MSTITSVIELRNGLIFVSFADGGCEALRRDDPADADRIVAAQAAVKGGALHIKHLPPDPRLANPPAELRLESRFGRDHTKVPLGQAFNANGQPLEGTRRVAQTGMHRDMDWHGAKKRGGRRG